METKIQELISTLARVGVEFIVVGGVAAFGQGSTRLTFDLDVVYRRSPENISRLVDCLVPLNPYLRGAPPGLPLQWNTSTVENGLNFKLITSIGALDLFGEIIGGGGYEERLPHSIKIKWDETECLCLGVEQLIKVKRAAGRPKDLEVIAELEALLEEKTKADAENRGT